MQPAEGSTLSRLEVQYQYDEGQLACLTREVEDSRGQILLP